MANGGSHRFGSDSTELKLDVIGAYLRQLEPRDALDISASLKT
jgi:hypothetical protein